MLLVALSGNRPDYVRCGANQNTEKSIALSRAHKRVWHRVLAGPASSTRNLLIPLGPWIREPNGKFPFFITTRGRVNKQLDGIYIWRNSS